ncbi:hypothetical protein E2542_SST28568 [Spatholobus suberectus]|nr:hypothetical protein E2542_SST28568 [Spatholobus suberectus]
MSFMRGVLLSRTRKIVKGLAKAQPGEKLCNIFFLTVITRAPSAMFPRAEATIQTITLPEDVYVKKFYKKYPDSKYHDAIKSVILFFKCIWNMMEYLTEKRAKKKAYTHLKEIACLQGKRLPPNPYPSPVKEIQAEERKYV